MSPKGRKKIEYRSYGPKWKYKEIVGKSQAIREVVDLLNSIVGTSAPVLILGESGTGKELVAQAVHKYGARREKPFISENCAAIPETLLESELFGVIKDYPGFHHKEGKKGLFELADGGTLFLDEIGDMSLSNQKKLLRVLEAGEIRRVGGSTTIKVDARIVSASNKDLLNLIKEGKFRDDLYYRLNLISFYIPPLRERKEDIPLLIEHFLKDIAKNRGLPPKKIDEGALSLLLKHSWPGNARELRNCIERAMIVARTGIIHEKNLFTTPFEVERPSRAHNILDDRNLSFREKIEACEKYLIEKALEENNYNQTYTAKAIGIPRRSLMYKMKKFGLGKKE